MARKYTLNKTTCLIVGFVLSSCSAFSGGDPSQIEGTINYQEPLFLTPDAVVEIKLLDVSLQDVAAKEIAAIKLSNPGQVPIAFTLDYDSALIDERMSYSIRADIFDRNRRMFTTDTSYGVITRGNSNRVEMTLLALRSNPISKPDASLKETYWKVIAVYSNAQLTAANQREAHIKFRGSNNAMQGFAGCNNFSGSYSASADKLSTGPLAVTMMACATGMGDEQQFLNALGEANRFGIQGDTMRLYKGDEVIVHLEAIYL
jgi:putative lipoprotein